MFICQCGQGVELYEHSGDPSDATSFGAFENQNLAYLPANEQLRASLSLELHTYWHGDGDGGSQ